MAFRDDQDALRARITALEAERDQLRAGLAPAMRQLRGRIFTFGMVLIVSTGLFLYTQQSETEGLREREAQARQQVETCEAAAAETQAEVRRLEREAERAREEARETREVRDAAEAASEARARAAEGVITSARVVRATGAAPVRLGASCTVDVRYEAQASGCHASVVCGDTDLYPRGGGGFFGCEIDAGRVMRGRDANPTSDSGDPEIDVALDRGTLTVTDTRPDWSVTLRWPGQNPF